LIEQFKVRHCLASQALGLCPRARHAEYRNEGRLSGGGIRTDRLSGFRRRALDIEQIVGDLERQPQIVGVPAQRGSQLA
jgi:hypothetical protein